MISLGDFNGYEKSRHIIPAQSVYTVDFTNTPKNFYRLNNLSALSVYASTGSLPRIDLYDFKADAHSVGNFTEPKKATKLYIYNPHTENVEVLLTSWGGEFNPLFMAVSEIQLNSDVTLKTDGIINEFNTSLPAGNNNIGNVYITGEALSKLIDINTTLQSGGAIYNSLSRIGDIKILCNSILKNMNSYPVNFCKEYDISLWDPEYVESYMGDEIFYKHIHSIKNLSSDSTASLTFYTPDGNFNITLQPNEEIKDFIGDPLQTNDSSSGTYQLYVDPKKINKIRIIGHNCSIITNV